MTTKLAEVEYEVRYDLSINCLNYLYQTYVQLDEATVVYKSLLKEGRNNVTVWKVLRVKMGAHLDPANG